MCGVTTWRYVSYTCTLSEQVVYAPYRSSRACRRCISSARARWRRAHTPLIEKERSPPPMKSDAALQTEETLGVGLDGRWSCHGSVADELGVPRPLAARCAAATMCSKGGMMPSAELPAPSLWLGV